MSRVFVFIFASLVAMPQAHAGRISDWFSNLCDKYLVADDPTQFELASDRWLMDEINRLEMKVDVWKKELSKRELSQLKILRKERDFRVELRNYENDNGEE